MATSGSFVFGEAINLIPKVLQERDCSFPGHPGDHFTTLYSPGPAPLSRSMCNSSAPNKVTNFQNLRVWAPKAVCKKELRYSVLLVPHSMVQRGFLPQFTFTHLSSAMLSPCNFGDPSATLQLYFLNIPSNLTSKQLCLRDKERPGSSYLCTILTPPLMSHSSYLERATTVKNYFCFKKWEKWDASRLSS